MFSDRALPTIIQGGMGVGVSDWRLARAVAEFGQLGVVSGTAMDIVLSRRLQLGDEGGHMRRALASFPLPEIAHKIVDRYYVEGGKAADRGFKAKPMPSHTPSKELIELLVAGNFVEVFLAKEGHDGMVGINYLEKIQLPTAPSIYGAMLAGVDCILMGAGIPRAVPGIMDSLAKGDSVDLRLNVQGLQRGDSFATRFEPEVLFDGEPPQLPRPLFFAIVASATLASMLARKASGRVDGFVIEGPTAGGHNAPPRGEMQLTADGQPSYGERDVPDLAEIKALGLPFWLAGSYAEPERVREAIELGAAGVQVGTAFAYCEESGLENEFKSRVLEMSRSGKVSVFTDPVASPTGFPFKVLDLPGTLSDPAVFEERDRVCDIGYLRQGYQRDDGTLGWRCPSEPVEDYVSKGGNEAATTGRRCVCNALLANIGLGQTRRDGSQEKALLTSGDDVATVARFLPAGAGCYKVVDVLRYLLGVDELALDVGD